MAGFTFMPINRSAVCAVTFASSGGTAVAGFPLDNVADPTPGHQARITPNGGSAGGDVIIQFSFAAAPAAAGLISGGGDVDYAVNSFYLGNHNVDNCTISLRGHTASNAYAGATDLVAATALDNSGAFPNGLVTFTARAYRYLYLRISGSTPNPVKIGNAIFGFSFDLGYPQRPAVRSSRPQSGSLVTHKGFDIPTGMDPPLVQRRLEFRGPTLETSVMTSRARTAGAFFVATNTIQRAFSTEYQHSLNSSHTSRTGVCAGSGYPIPYHDGDAYGISAWGRPAQMANMVATIPEFWVRELSAITLDIRDVQPRGADLKPTTN